MDYLLVGIGGIFGSITRFILGRYISERTISTFPKGTFIINVSGALLLGVVVTFQSHNNVYLLLGDGFLGAYTTFSTFMYEGFNLFQEKERLNAFKYIFYSLILGTIGFSIGVKLGGLFHLM